MTLEVIQDFADIYKLLSNKKHL